MFLIPKKLDQNRSSLKNLLTQNAFGQKPKSRGWKKSDQKKNEVNKLKTPQNYLVKIESVTAEILLIWTNVARANVACTNVAITVGISSRWSQESTFKVWSKLGQ